MDDNKSNIFAMRLTSVLRKRLEMWSSRAGMKPSEFARMVLLAHAADEAKRLGVFREGDLADDLTNDETGITE